MKPLVEWPAQERNAIRGVLTDIDDTLTTHGRLLPEVLASLAQIRNAGLHLVAITGRPTWWAMPLLRLCGFHAVVAENGASAFWLDAQDRIQSWFYADPEMRSEHRRALDAFVPLLQQRFPGLSVADDAAQRVGDLAFDIGENINPLPTEQVSDILSFMREHGFFAIASSIHAHASLTKFSKQTTATRILNDVFGVNDEVGRNHYVFVGDSANDASMFAHYPYSIGVANIERHLSKIAVPPRYLASRAYGAGFVEFANFLLAAR